MDEWTSKMKGITDCHVHMGGISEEASLIANMEATGIEKMALVAIQNPAGGSGLPQALYMKSRHPAKFFVMAGLNHAEKLSGGRVKTLSLADQVKTFVEMGCDGIKMIEGKPTSRQRMNIPVTDPYYADYWACVEDLKFPVIWHVNDPEEFWDPEKIPYWAKQRNWGYGPNDVQKEQLYSEVDEVLSRHPDLRIVFAHFYFLSADLDRARRFLDQHPTVHFDLAPGVEMLHNTSVDPEASRQFFIEYADRIVFGTDIFSGLKPQQARARAGIVFRWLESDDAFPVPEFADFLLGTAEDGLIKGMRLPDEVLSKIYRENFARLAGDEPRTLDRAKAIEECRRLAAISEALSGKSAEETQAAIVARELESV